MSHEAKTDHKIHELLSARRSPYSYTSQAVSKKDLASLFEAARWSASSYNEQPWRFIVATKDDAGQYDKLLGCLVEGNRVWAQHAPVLVLGCTIETFALNGKPNAAADHDLGLALANLTFEATARGLFVHPMVGIEPEKARSEYNIPENAHALTAFAIGYIDRDSSEVAEDIKSRDDAPRARKPLTEILYESNWGSPRNLG